MASNNTAVKTSNYLSLQSHLVEDVPYVGQETGIDCELCSFTMLVQHLQKDYTLHDMFYLIGAGHALGGNGALQKLKHIKQIFLPPEIDPGSIECIWKNDWQYLEPILGVKTHIIYTEHPKDSEKAWEDYWQRVKTYLINDAPVYTQIDMSKLTYYIKNNVFPPNSPAICHAIVLVGFNESNSTVCINDPEPAYDGKPEAGQYVYENISTLHDAVIRATESSFVIYKFGYLTITLENVSNALPKKQAVEITRYRNIQKMKGCPCSYDPVFVEPGAKFGIRALKLYKNKMQIIKVLPKLPTWFILNRGAQLFSEDDNSTFPFGLISTFIPTIKLEKQFAAETLLKYCDTASCHLEGILLQNESEKWGEFYLSYNEFVELLKNKGLGSTLFLSINLLRHMQEILGDLIHIEEEIIQNYSE